MTEGQQLEDNVKVAVRVRPLNKREIDLDSPVVVFMHGNQTILKTSPNSSDSSSKTFSFDYCFESTDKNASTFSSQEDVFRNLGDYILVNALKGYNACMFAYGQTGSGKTYTMMGNQSNPGIIPRLCEALFDRVNDLSVGQTQFKVEVSYMEIYNEKVYDLFDITGTRKALNIREHNILGPYVDGLSKLLVCSVNEVKKLMEVGNKSRTVGATNMNVESSRSHAVFTITLSSTVEDLTKKKPGEKVSRISLVDLAGSERARKTGTEGQRLREGCNINKSLATLMRVIASLSSVSGNSSKGSANGKLFIPYRDSTLTWLLKDSLGGNSKTVMIATLSPVLDNYDETLSTLRYANHAKNIVNHAIVNEDPNTKLIKELREEVQKLRAELFSAKSLSPQIKEQLNQSETLIKEYSKTWEEKMNEAKYQLETRQSALGNLGISVQPEGIRVKSDRVYLVNLNPDPSLNEMLIYYLKERNIIGSGSLDEIKLGGVGIQPSHCTIEVESAKVYITPNKECRTLINGKAIAERHQLHNRDRLVLGLYQFFRVNCPEDQSRSSELPTSTFPESDYFSDKSELSDYEFARQELLQNDLAKNLHLERIMKDINYAYIEEKDHRPQNYSMENSTMQALPDTQSELYGFNKRGNISKSFIGFNSNRYNGMMESQMSTPNNFSQSENGYPRQHFHVYNTYLQEKEKFKKACLTRLKQQLAKAHSLVSEANFMASALKIEVKYSVTLQIPVSSLCLNRNNSNFITIEPAIQVLRLDDARTQIWNIDKLMDKLVDMREIYSYEKATFHPGHSSTDSGLDSIGQPDCNYLGNSTIRNGAFYSYEDDLSLIGVSNVHLSCFFQCQRFKYLAPIINQQGEVNGKMKIELKIAGGSLVGYNKLIPSTFDNIVELNNMSNSIISNGTDSGVSGMSSSQTKLTFSVTIHCCFKIPAKMTKSLQCVYRFWDEENHVVVSVQNNSSIEYTQEGAFVKFNHTSEFNHVLNEELLEHLSNHTISFELYGASFSQVEGQALLQDYLSHSLINPLANVDLCDAQMSRKDRKFRGLSLNETKNNEAEAIKEVNGIISNINAVKTFAERWKEVYRKIELWIAIEELNDEGYYEKVPVTADDQVQCGGIYQLKQGVSKRIRVLIRPNKANRPGSGSLPVSCQYIKNIEIGCIESVGHKLNTNLIQSPKNCPSTNNKSTSSLRRNASINSTYPNHFSHYELSEHSSQATSSSHSSYDSYQEIDLLRMRETWTTAMSEKQAYLKENLQELSKYTKKTTSQMEREDVLLQRWLRTTDERDLVLIPPEGSGIPGAPASWTPLPTMEFHSPIIFMNLQPNDYCEEALKDPIRDLNIEDIENGPNEMQQSDRIYGHDSSLENEGLACRIRAPHVIPSNGKHSDSVIFPTPFKQLSLVKRYEKLVGAVATWDVGLHDCVVLNRVTPPSERIFAIAKVTFHITRPITADIVMRKRICLNISKKEGIADYFRKTFSKLIQNPEPKELWTCVVYQLVSSVPQTTHEMESRDSLAKMAAESESAVSSSDVKDKENLIEKYLKAVSAVESLFYLDKLRQESSSNDQRYFKCHSRIDSKNLDFSDSSEGTLESSKRYTSQPNLDEEDAYFDLTSSTISRNSNKLISDSNTIVNRRTKKLNISKAKQMNRYSVDLSSLDWRDYSHHGDLFLLDKKLNTVLEQEVTDRSSFFDDDFLMSYQLPPMPSVSEEESRALAHEKETDPPDIKEENMAWNRKVRSRMQRKTVDSFYIPPLN